MLTPGRGSNVGGRKHRTTRLCGNKYWKYLIWKYAGQLIAEGEVPGYLSAMSELVTKNHNTTRSTRTCGACKIKFKTRNHGHSCNESDCPLYLTQSAKKKRERKARKLVEAYAIGFDIIKTEWAQIKIN
jgi:hypothetical protein